MRGVQVPSSRSASKVMSTAGATVSPPVCTGAKATFWPSAGMVAWGAWVPRMSPSSVYAAATQVSGVTRRTARSSWSRLCRTKANGRPPTFGTNASSISAAVGGGSSVGVTSGAIRTSVRGMSFDL